MSEEKKLFMREAGKKRKVKARRERSRQEENNALREKDRLTGLFMMSKKLIGSTRGESRNLKQRKKMSL